MKPQQQPPFLHFPPSIHGHFVLNLYAAIYHLFQYVRWLEAYGGESLEALGKRYPFLMHYHDQLHQHMPPGMAGHEGSLWWQETIGEWEQCCPMRLPLRSLAQHCPFSFSQRMALLICGLVEEDSRFGTVLGELQAPLPHRFVTLELLDNVLSCQADTSNMGRPDSMAECRSLIALGLVECLNTDAARSEWLLRVPPALWETIRSGIQATPLPGSRYHAPESFAPLGQLVYVDAFLQSLQRLPALLGSGQVNTLVLRSDLGSDPVEVMGAVAKASQQGLLVLSPAASRDGKVLKLVGPLAALAEAMPVLDYELAPGEVVGIPALTAWMGATGICAGLEGGLEGAALEHSLNLTLPTPDRQLRLHHWQQHLGQDNPDISSIADTFQVSGKYIRQMAGMAASLALMGGDAAVRLPHVREASRSLNRQTLETLADHLPSAGSWTDLACNPDTNNKLHELQQRCAHRERLLQHLGPAFNNNANRGVRALFTGVSGTGKTLAARILAAELGMDLYRVDLAAVVNKYIGETEKNLHKILSRAEALDIVLLLDEGDALLGGRTDVKSSNDRYANLETNYLLQRLEHYQGIIVVTTNMSDNIDRAFKRRMDVVVPFYAPQMDERWAIMQLHLPAGHAVEDSFLQRVAQHCPLTGGQIRNVVANASLRALGRRQAVSSLHLERALQAEYQKAGGIYPLQNRYAEAAVDEMGNFISALAGLRY